METRHNESTELRPEGDRKIEGPLVTIDLPKFVNQITSEDSWFKNDRNAITVYKTNKYRITVVAMHSNAEMETDQENLVSGIVSIKVLQGNLQLTVNGESTSISNGQIAVIHENMPYKLKATETSIFLLTKAGENP